jgi:hypothetical protein
VDILVERHRLGSKSPDLGADLDEGENRKWRTGDGLMVRGT